MAGPVDAWDRSNIFLAARFQKPAPFPSRAQEKVISAGIQA